MTFAGDEPGLMAKVGGVFAGGFRNCFPPSKHYVVRADLCVDLPHVSNARYPVKCGMPVSAKREWLRQKMVNSVASFRFPTDRSGESIVGQEFFRGVSPLRRAYALTPRI
jgi:hypothetical protein